MFRALLAAVSITAPDPAAAAQSAEYHKVEGYVGYSHNRVDTGIADEDDDLDDAFDERSGHHGFNASVAANVSRYVGLKFDLSGHFKHEDTTVPFPSACVPGPCPIVPTPVEIKSRVWNFLGGVQLKDNSTEARFKPFAHPLVRGAHATVDLDSPTLFDALNQEFSDTGLAGAVGGGLDARAGRRVDVRVIQIDYNPSRLFDGTQDNFRVGAGVVLH